MIITIASFKGGVGKTVTAVHLAAFLAEQAPTLLLDGDSNRQATEWARGGNLPFKVADERQAAKLARDFEHTVIDTQAKPSKEDMRTLAGGCDLLIIPTIPDALSMSAMLLTVDALRTLKAESFRILLTIVPPPPNHDAADARQSLTAAGLPLFESEIRRFIAYSKAALAGVIVRDVQDDRAKEAWSDYQRLGNEILKGK